MGEIGSECKSYFAKTIIEIRELESNIRLLQFVRPN